MSLSTTLDAGLVVDQDWRRSLPRPLIYGIFLLSGGTALIYQTAWQRLLGLFSGSDTVAATIVVGAFLLGLGIGSLAGAGLADRLTRRAALRAFALCELLIGLFAAASPILFYDVLFGQLIGYAGRVDLVIALTFLFLLPPTLLMGLSLPLLARAVADRIETAAVDVGLLYGVNTLGACVGTFLAGWLIIGTIGYAATIYLGAVLNLVVALGAIQAQRGLPSEPTFAPRPSKAAASAHATGGAGARVWYWSGLVFLSGFLIIALEIVWFRLLGVLMQSNAYAFSLVLAVFLLGDALGIFAGAALVQRIRDLRRAFLLLQGGMACYALGSALVLHWAHGSFPGFIATNNSGLFETIPILLAVAALTALVVLPPAFLLGMSFPVAQRAVQDDPDLVGQRVGLIQLFNILGNALGALIAGLVLIHWLGTIGTLRLIAVAGVLLLIPCLREWRPDRTRATEVFLVAATAVAFFLLPSNAGFWARMHGASAPEEALVAEDRTGIAVLRRWDNDTHSLYIAGHSQSGLPFGSYHLMLGLVGVALHPDPKSVLIIGQGTGGTPYGAGANPATEEIRVLEIVGPVLQVMEEAAKRGVDPGLARYFADSRYERMVADARHALFIEGRRYDVIEADAIYPHSSRAGMLYSVEYFRQVLARLNPGGIFVQWQPTERTERTFRAVFPHIVHLGAVLLGSNEPIHVDLTALAERLRGPMRSYIEAAGIDPDRIVADLGESLVVHRPGEDRPSRRLNTDLFPRDEYYLNSPVRDW